MTAPYWEDDAVALYLGDCLDVLRTLPDASVDAVVTDPPAGIHFMGREWDGDRGGRDQWIDWLAQCLAEAARVLKPGGHALVWALPRTSHWTAMAVEDAGLEIRDCVTHLFGSGFPKSLDVGKAIDKTKRRDYVLAALDLGLQIPGNNLHDWTKAEHSPGDAWWTKFKQLLSPEEWQRIERKVIALAGSGTAHGRSIGPVGMRGGTYEVTSAATAEAARWDGWGTALKPAAEHWWLARHPLAGTVAATVLEHGTGALNIGACRVEAGSRPLRLSDRTAGNDVYGDGLQGSYAAGETSTGRWPTNVVLSHPPLVVDGEVVGDACADGCVEGCPVAELDRQSGVTRTGTSPLRRNTALGVMNDDGWRPKTTEGVRYAGEGGASRFFPTFRYEAKASASERPKLPDGTAWPTVKPVALMQWLVRLVTPPGGVVLDPFAGTGTTAEAAVVEGFRALLIERDPKATELIKTRLAKPIAPVLGFEGEIA